MTVDEAVVGPEGGDVTVVSFAGRGAEVIVENLIGLDEFGMVECGEFYYSLKRVFRFRELGLEVA
jgi:hypothetical protein